MRGPDGQRAAAGHGVARIDREIDDDLLELALVDLDEAEVAAVHHLQLDVLADQPAQQVRQLGQHVGDVEDARLQGLLAREGQQLAHEVGGAVGVLLDLHDVGERLVARPVAQQQQIAEADHRGQQVVEVVGDAAGQLADRLHLLATARTGPRGSSARSVSMKWRIIPEPEPVSPDTSAVPARRRA